MNKLFTIITVVVLACAFLGCKEKTPEEKGKEALKAAAEKVPDSPDKVVTEAAKAVKEGNFVLIYAMLPDSYQKDVQGVVKKFAGKMDKELWEKAFALLPKVLEVAKKAEEKPLEEDQLAMAEAVLKMLTEAKLNTYDGLNAFDIPGFLATNQKAIHGLVLQFVEKDEKGKEILAMLDTVKAEVKETKDDTATVEISMGKDKMPVPFVKVDGKWIPVMIQAEWKEIIEETMAGLDELPDFKDEKQKKQFALMIDSFGKALDGGAIPPVPIPGLGGGE